tara:strand:- start:2080 stop:3108 length:1029 start_codon:yes stop_codon:yes gene_type:complete
MALTKVSKSLISTDTVFSVDALGGVYGNSSSPVSIAVTVASKTAGHPYNGDGSSSAYFLDGVEAPAILLNGADDVTSDSGYYYKFDQADSSNSGHPLLFYLDAAKSTAYSTGVTTSGTPGNAGAYTRIDVDSDTPKVIYYQCSSHAYMGNYAAIPASKNFYNLAVGGVTITSTGAELNILDGVTSTTAELNILDGVTATAAELNYLDIGTLGLTAASKAVTADANGVVTHDAGISEEYTAVTSSSAAVSLNLRLGNNFSHDLTENTTVSFANPAASGKVSAATLRIIQGSTARTITWNSSIKWAADTAPTLSTGNDNVDIFVFYTVDAGTTYYGFTAGQVMS